MSKNTMKTWVLMAALGGAFVLIGGAIGGTSGMVIAVGFAVLLNFATYWWADKMVIAMTRSKPVSEQEAPWLYEIVRRLTQKADMPMPRLYIMPSAQPNAFATGRNPEYAAVAVTEGILGAVTREELEGVLAHEICHVRNRDILIGAIAATIAAAFTMVARFALFFGGGRDDRDNSFGPFAMLFAWILAPIGALMIQMAISRSREAEADRSAVRLLGDATPLASALIKIHQVAQHTPAPDVSPAVSHVFIQNPLRAVGVAKLFRSHPPLEERLAQLRAMGARV